MAAFALSGMAALIYEVAWTRQLSMVFSSTVYALSIMLASFMAGLSLGGWLGGRWADARRIGPFRLGTTDQSADLTSDLGAVEFLIGTLGLASVLIVQILPRIQYALIGTLGVSPGAFFAAQMLLAFLVMLVPTTLMGATLPLASKLTVRSYRSLGSTLGLLYSLNTIGAVAGSLLAGFVLIPFVGVRATVIAAALVNLAVSAVLMLAARRRPTPSAAVGLAVFMILGLVVVAVPEPAYPLSLGVVRQYHAYAEYAADVSTLKVLYEDENEYSRVVVAEDTRGTRFLVNGSLTEGSDGDVDVATTSLLAALPHAFASSPERTMVIGLGTGYTSRSMLGLQGVGSVTTVEINRAVVPAARLFIGNEPFTDPRFDLVIDDARGHLQTNNDTYDLITSEPSWPLASAVAPLFTKEFYELADQRLRPEGVFCQWAPQYLLPRKDFMTLYRTFESVFPGAQVWTISHGADVSGDLLIVGVKDGDYAPAAAVQRAVQASLKQQGIENVSVSVAPFEDVMREAITDPSVALNTDDRPVLEFNIPWELVRKVAEELKN